MFEKWLIKDTDYNYKIDKRKMNKLGYNFYKSFTKIKLFENQ